MYPQINLSGGFTNPAPIQTTPPLGSASFGGPGSPSTATTTLRVVVAEQFRVAPPVPAPPSAATAAPPGTAAPSQQGASGAAATGAETDAVAPIDFSYEKKVLAELENGGAGLGDEGETGPQRQDRFEALVSQCMSSGSCTREEAALALAVALSTAGHRADGAAVQQAAAALKHLVSMGFSKQDAVGALVAKGGDLSAALDMLTV